MVIPKEKITRPILYVNQNLSLKMHVMLSNKKPNGPAELFHKEFNQSINLNIVSFLTLEYRNQEIEWNSSQSFTINQRNLYIVLSGLKRMKSILYDENSDLFTMNKSNELLIDGKKAAESTIVIEDKVKNQAIQLVPSIVFDEQERSYEGVSIFINNSVNLAQVDIEKFDALLLTLANIDLFVYSQMLVNYYMTYMATLNETPTIPGQTFKPKARAPVNQSAPPTTSNLPKKTAKDIFGL